MIASFVIAENPGPLGIWPQPYARTQRARIIAIQEHDAGVPKRLPHGVDIGGRAAARANRTLHADDGWKRQPKSTVAAAVAIICAAMNAGAETGAMPAKVLDRVRAIVTAGLAKDVDAVNQ
jgi:hypothetical protein